MCRYGIDEIFEKGERKATRGKSTQPEGNANQFSFSRRERVKLTTACRPSEAGRLCSLFVFDDIQIGKFANLKNNLYFCH